MQQMDSEVCILALQQCGDILRLQEEACNILQEKLSQTSSRVPAEDHQAIEEALQSERVGHQQTGRLLEQEREKARLAEAELAILRRQLTREKTTFENAFGLLKSQALTDSSKAEDLLAKCSALQALCAQKDEELVSKEETISQLQLRLKAVQERHSQELMEVRVRMQQDAYVARHLVDRQDRPQRRAKKRHT